MPENHNFTLRTEFITLGQLLKAASIVSTGSEAKDLLAQGGIYVNEELECRRGKKLRPSDTVRLANGETISISGTESALP